MTERRRKEPISGRLVLLIAAILAIVVIVLSFVVVKFTFFAEEEKEPEKPEVAAAVSDETMTRLTEGTILRFGDSNKPHVTVIADPVELSRTEILIDGKPSPLLKAVENKEINLNLYLAPNAPERANGVDSVIRAATCKLSTERTSNGLFSLLSIVSVADKIKGQESLAQVAKMMKMPEDVQCAQASNEAAMQTSDNARHFMTQFSLDKPHAIIAGGVIVKDFTELRDDWVQYATRGSSAQDFLRISEGE